MCMKSAGLIKKKKKTGVAYNSLEYIIILKTTLSNWQRRSFMCHPFRPRFTLPPFSISTKTSLAPATHVKEIRNRTNGEK